MQNKKITVADFEGVILTLPRVSKESLSTTVIVKTINETVETLSFVKQKGYGLTNATPTVPRQAPSVPLY